MANDSVQRMPNPIVFPLVGAPHGPCEFGEHDDIDEDLVRFALVNHAYGARRLLCVVAREDADKDKDVCVDTNHSAAVRLCRGRRWEPCLRILQSSSTSASPTAWSISRIEMGGERTWVSYRPLQPFAFPVMAWKNTSPSSET